MPIRTNGFVTLTLTVVILTFIIALTLHARVVTNQHLQTLLALESAEFAYWEAEHQRQRLRASAMAELP